MFSSQSILCNFDLSLTYLGHRGLPQASQLGTQQTNSRCCAHDVGHNWGRNGNKVTYHVNCHGPSWQVSSVLQRVIIATFLLGERIGRWLELAKSAAFIHLSLHVRCSYVLFLHRASRLCSGWKRARRRKMLRSKNSSAPRQQHLRVR